MNTAATMRLASDDAQGLVIRGIGDRLAEGPPALRASITEATTSISR